MTKPVYVTTTRPRKPVHPTRHILLAPIASVPYHEIINFSVALENSAKAKQLAQEAWEEYKNGHLERARKINDEVLALQAPEFEEMSTEEQWTYIGLQLPTDIGGSAKRRIASYLSSRCIGRVLETMCGFNTYLLPAGTRQVTALDFSREMLELYPYPGRTRIKFDLNTLSPEQGFDFFAEGQFNAITLCFGYQYLENPYSVFREFYRLLGPGGSLLMVENPAHGYSDMIHHRFDPGTCRQILASLPFKLITLKELPFSELQEREMGSIYWSMEAVK
jgi:SAM-dependent methyltransferase